MENRIIDILNKCSDLYYNIGEFYKLNEIDGSILKSELDISFSSYPVDVTDEIYDEIYSIAKQKYINNPYFNSIGASVVEEYGEEVEFDTPMGSMEELKEGDWDKWAFKNTLYVISEKLDGLSVILFYEDGKLVKAATRGDGHKGKLITCHVMQINNIPKEISIKDSIQVRGELICPKLLIPNMISDLKEETGKEYKNGRNTITGFLSSKNTLKSVIKYAKFMAFDTTMDYDYNELDKFVILQKEKFETPKVILQLSDIFNEKDLENLVKDVKTNGEFEADGIVITIANSLMFQGFETGTINPKRSRKFKLGAINNTTESIVKDIKWQISRYGIFTPVIEIEPVELVGVTIVKATGHNYKNIIDNKIGIGSKVVITRSGDVIPYIKKVIEPSDNIPLPLVETYVEGVDLILKNKETSSVFVYEMMIQKLVSFCDSLEIENADRKSTRLNSSH